MCQVQAGKTTLIFSGCFLFWKLPYSKHGKKCMHVLGIFKSKSIVTKILLVPLILNHSSVVIIAGL